MPKIIILPTSHISEESITRIRNEIKNEKPDCVAVELDFLRYRLLSEKEKSPKSGLGFSTTFLIFALTWLQNWLGRKVGIMPGSEMLSAIAESQKAGIKIAFIDQEIIQTFQKIKSISLKEKIKLLFYVFEGLLLMPLISRFSKDRFDLKKVPPKDLIKTAMIHFRQKFPKFYKILVEERDEYMSERILQLSRHFEKVLVVTGAGHEKGIKKHLKKFPIFPIS